MRLPYLVLALATMVSAAELTPPLTFHASFDDSLEATARGDGRPVKVDGPVAYRPGKFGRALLCGEGGATLTYRTEGNLRRTAGTISMWVSPVDWTGAEDTFHVFLEAKDPGWLVLYRYYQGGILILAGPDQKNYRGAQGPRITWRKGEWHHLAATWRAGALATYVDGKKVATVPAPALPDGWPAEFRLGDHPWHVPRQQQTLLDEVRLYGATLDDEAIARLARGEEVAYRSRFDASLAVDSDQGVLAVSVETSGVVGEPAGRSATVALIAADGRIVASGKAPELRDDLGLVELPVGALPAGEYQVKMAVLGPDGAELATATAPFRHPGPAVWSGNTLGLADQVLPPWTPLRVKAPTVECWGRGYRYGTLLAGATSQGAELLAEPVRLSAAVGGRTVALDGAPAKVTASSDTRAELTAQAAGPGLTAAATHQVEYDGFTWTDLTVTPDGTPTTDELTLTWAMPAARATLFHADRLKWAKNPAGALPAEGWTSDDACYFWVGNEAGGLAWYYESDEGWEPAPDRPRIEVRRDGDLVKVTVRLIAKPTALTGPRSYGFGFMATPVRPRPADARKLRMDPAPRPTFRIIWPNGNFKFYGHTEPIDPDTFARTVTESQQSGCRVVPYINLNYASAGLPEWQYYGARWHDGVRAVTPSDVAAMGHASMGTCPAARDWQDYILYRINEMIDRYQVDGIYIDCWCPYPCTFGGCGWLDAGGKAHPTHPIRAYRDILKRVYTLFWQKRPNPLMMVHMSSEVDIPMLSFTDTILDGEQFRSLPLAADYLPLLPPDTFRAEFMQSNWGPMTFFLPELSGENVAKGTPNLAAYLLLHDVQPWPIWSDAKVWRTLYDALDAVGYTESRFHPYWDSPPAAADGSILVSGYTSAKGVVLAVMNLGEARQARLEPNPAQLKLRAVAGATDMVSGEDLRVEGGAVLVPLARHQGRVILLR